MNRKNTAIYIFGVCCIISSITFLAISIIINNNPLMNLLFFIYFLTGFIMIEKSKKDYVEEINELNKEIDILNNNINEYQTKEETIKKDLLYWKEQVDKVLIENNELKKENNKLNRYNKKTIEYIDSLNGIEFEEYFADTLKSIGFINVEVTPASNDYGVDIVAEKDNIKYAIQCKNYKGILGNSCVQEVYSGKNYYNCHVAVVATNSTFSKNAKELAEKDGVLLWDREKIKEMINK